MGRGLRHLRCIRCRQRKVKCDGAKPQCDNCLRHGQQCPGYPPQFEFKDEREELERRFRSKLSASSLHPSRDQTPEQLLEGQGDVNDANDSRPKRSQASPAPTQNGKDERRDPPSQLAIPPGNAVTLLRSRLVHRLRLPPHLMLDIYGLTFFPFLPRHVGQCDALDSAVDLLCYVHDARIAQRGISNKMLRMQSSLLSTLHNSLMTPQCDAFPETLASAIIAMNIGHHSEDYLSNFIAHSAGIRALIAARGPPNEHEDFYLALLNSIWGLLWTSALMQGDSCFQEEPSWRGKPHPDCDKYFISSVLAPILQPFPGLVRDVKLFEQDPSLRESIYCRNDAFRRQLLTPDFRIAPLQDEILQSLASGPPNMSPFYPASAEFLAYLACLAACLAISRRILTIVEPQSSFRADELTKLNAANEILRFEQTCYTAAEGFTGRRTTSNEYVRLTLNILKNLMASLEDQEFNSLMRLQINPLVQEVVSSESPEAHSNPSVEDEWGPAPSVLPRSEITGDFDCDLQDGLNFFGTPDYSSFDNQDFAGDLLPPAELDGCGIFEEFHPETQCSPTPLGTAG